MLLAWHRAWLAEAGGEPAGYLGLGLAANCVLHLHVGPGWQGHGVGRGLLAVARAASPRGLALHVFQRNLAARRFHERQGFRAAERRPASANEEGEPDPLYLLAPATPDPTTGVNA